MTLRTLIHVEAHSEDTGQFVTRSCPKFCPLRDFSLSAVERAVCLMAFMACVLVDTDFHEHYVQLCQGTCDNKTLFCLQGVPEEVLEADIYTLLGGSILIIVLHSCTRFEGC